MEHIVQFAIGIDDDAIIKRVTENAEMKIIEDLKQQVANKLFEPYRYNKNADPTRDPLSYFAQNLVNDFFEENKDIIINKAAEILSNRLAKTKKAKEALNSIFQEGE